MLNHKLYYRYTIITWLACFAIILVAEILLKDSPWLYDAAAYWYRGDVLKNTMFDLTSIDAFRGYCFPLYLGLINCIGRGGRPAWMIINASLYATFIAFFIPNMSRDLEYSKRVNIRIIISGILVVTLFWGLFAYPLSDLFGLMCCCCAIFFARKSIENQTKIRYLYAFFMGFSCYCAYNVRTIYLFSAIVVLILYVLICIKNKIKYYQIVTGFSSSVLGLLSATIPQVIVNRANLGGKFNIFVQTEGLMLQQMSWGIKYQRYDTYICAESDEIHYMPQMYFNDPSGIEILREMGIEEFETWRDFFRVFYHHPVDVAIIYIKHFINYIFPCWPEVYVTNLNSQKWILGLVSLTIWFLFMLAVGKKCFLEYKTMIYYIPIIIAGILIVPGAVEYRFSIPLFLFVISQLCFNVDYSKLKREVMACKINVIILYIIFVALCFSVWSNMLSNEWMTPLLFK